MDAIPFVVVARNCDGMTDRRHVPLATPANPMRRRVLR